MGFITVATVELLTKGTIRGAITATDSFALNAQDRDESTFVTGLLLSVQSANRAIKLFQDFCRPAECSAVRQARNLAIITVNVVATAYGFVKVAVLRVAKQKLKSTSSPAYKRSIDKVRVIFAFHLYTCRRVRSA